MSESTLIVKKKVLVTGGTGFIGHALLECLARRPDVRLLAWTRRVDALLPVGVIPVSASRGRMFAAGGQADELDTVIHCAARVHVMADKAEDSLAEFRKANVDLTLALARSAVEAGARRFIFLSSVKVNGEASTPGRPFTAADQPAPVGPYATSKYEAEVGLRRISEESGLEVVVIRTPLVYGPGVKANFRTMMRILSIGLPLPLGGLENRRSLVALDNLINLIVTCIDHPAAANQTFMISDGEDLSTSALLQRLAVAMGRPARLLPLPERALGWLARLLGRQEAHARLCGSLQVDVSDTCERLGWSPRVRVDEALRKTAADFLRRKRN